MTRPCKVSRRPADAGSRTGESGFTLLELVAAAAIMSFILASVYATFFLSQKAIDAADGSLSALHDSRTALERMVREIESACCSQGTRDLSFVIEDRDIYGKQASRLSFTTFSPLAPGSAAVSYAVEEKEGSLVLMKKMVAPSFSKKPQSAPAEMIEGIEAFTVEAKQSGVWVRTWDASVNGKTPEAVRITITVKVGERTVTICDIAKPRIGKPV